MRKWITLPARLILALARLILEFPAAILSSLRLLLLLIRFLGTSAAITLSKKLNRLLRGRRGATMDKEVLSDEIEIPERPGGPSQGGPGIAPGADPGPKGSENGSCNQDAADLVPLCEDLIGLPFEAWEMFAARPKKLGEWERAALGKRLAEIVVKHNLQDKITSELMFASILTVAVGRRIKEEKAAHGSHKDDDNNRKAGDGKIDAREGTDRAV